MKWSDLSLEAKNVIEWVESPFTGKYNKLTITVGNRFIMPQTDIMITQELFDEIVSYTTTCKYICGEISKDNKHHIFEFTQEYKNKFKE